LIGKPRKLYADTQQLLNEVADKDAKPPRT